MPPTDRPDDTNGQETTMTTATDAANALWQAEITMADGRPAATLTDARYATQTLGVIPVEPVDEYDPANGTWLVILRPADCDAIEDMGYVVLDGPNGRVDVELA